MRRSYVGSGNPNFGKKHSTKTKELIREKAVGRKASLATKIKMSKSHKGKIVWNTGRQTPKEVREKIRASWAKIAYIRIGERNPNWNGGTTTLRSRVWHSIKYKNWRNSIFQRDNYTCVLCQAKSQKGMAIRLEADHYPKPFASFIREATNGEKDNIFEKVMIFEPLWLSSGRTLCVDCHNKTKRSLTRP